MSNVIVIGGGAAGMMAAYAAALCGHQVKLMEQNEGLPLYVLHDGPPYANGDIHMGTALNKVLKDIIIKYKNMSGYKAPYIPGWDTHGLPIELKAMKKVGVENINSALDLRKVCKEFALH